MINFEENLSEKAHPAHQHGLRTEENNVPRPSNSWERCVGRRSPGPRKKKTQENTRMRKREGREGKNQPQGREGRTNHRSQPQGEEGGGKECTFVPSCTFFFSKGIMSMLSQAKCTHEFFRYAHTNAHDLNKYMLSCRLKGRDRERRKDRYADMNICSVC